MRKGGWKTFALVPTFVFLIFLHSVAHAHDMEAVGAEIANQEAQSSSNDYSGDNDPEASSNDVASTDNGEAEVTEVGDDSEGNKPVEVKKETLKVEVGVSSQTQFPGFIDASQLGAEELLGMNDPTGRTPGLDFKFSEEALQADVARRDAITPQMEKEMREAGLDKEAIMLITRNRVNEFYEKHDFGNTEERQKVLDQKYFTELCRLSKGEGSDGKLGNPAAAEALLSEIKTRTYPGYRDRYIQNLREKHNKTNPGIDFRAPSEDQIHGQHNIGILRGYNAFGPYRGWSEDLKGTKSSAIDPEFQRPDIVKAFNSFPDKTIVQNQSGQKFFPSTNHLFNGLADELPTSDDGSVPGILSGLSSGSMAELIKDKKDREPGTVGSCAAENEDLQRLWAEDPVKAYQSFNRDPDKYLTGVNRIKYNIMRSLTPDPTGEILDQGTASLNISP